MKAFLFIFGLVTINFIYYLFQWIVIHQGKGHTVFISNQDPSTWVVYLCSFVFLNLTALAISIVKYFQNKPTKLKDRFLSFLAVVLFFGLPGNHHLKNTYLILNWVFPKTLHDCNAQPTVPTETALKINCD